MTQSELLRVYLDPAEIGLDGYPYAWHGVRHLYEANGPPPTWEKGPAIKDLVREQAGHRCERCGHPYPPGITETHPRGEWTPCDDHCTHGAPIRVTIADSGKSWIQHDEAEAIMDLGADNARCEAHWRILTVHHLNGVKHDCRWWNLAALCQRCHLLIQGKVVMERPWIKPHTEWFRSHAAGYYCREGATIAYVAGGGQQIVFQTGGPEPTREWVMEHIEEILLIHQTQLTIEQRL